MNKLKYLLLILPFLFIGSVKAEDTVTTVNFSYVEQPTINCNFYYYDYDYLLEQGFEDEIKELYFSVIKEYNENYSNNYKYYVISLFVDDSQNCNNSSRGGISRISMSLLAFNEEIPLYYFNNYPYYEGGVDIAKLFDNVALTHYYDVSENLYVTSAPHRNSPILFNDINGVNLYNPLYYFISNYNFVNTPVTMNYSDGTRIVSYIYNVTGYGEDFTIGVGDTIYPMFSADSPFDENNSYVEVNLNEYAYIALALKDYSLEPFTTEVYAKGNYCITPVYNYGMTERNEILDGTKIERCSPYYENYTPIRTYILDSDLKNNAIYYLKAYDTTKDNYVKIDTSVFDITYITEENKDNPYVMINGKSYPTIPYDELTDSATISEDEGYVSGTTDFSFSDIFTAPLDFLENLWDSIKSVFDLIKELFSLLPEPIPTFLIISFTLAIVLGLLKIIL